MRRESPISFHLFGIARGDRTPLDAHAALMVHNDMRCLTIEMVEGSHAMLRLWAGASPSPEARTLTSSPDLLEPHKGMSMNGGRLHAPFGACNVRTVNL